jgi:hypothetical protein
MKTDRVFDVLKEIEMGFIPYEFTFNLEPKCQIDYTYWLAKMPDGLLEQFPCLIDWAVESNIPNTKKSPLMELEERMAQCSLVPSSENDQ